MFLFKIRAVDDAPGEDVVFANFSITDTGIVPFFDKIVSALPFNGIHKPEKIQTSSATVVLILIAVEM